MNRHYNPVEKNNLLFLLFVPIILLSSNCTSERVKNENPLDFVDPFIGTGFHGHTFPGATLPFGMVQLSPDTHLDGWDASSGYHYDDTQIFAFSHTHLSGTGIGDLGDVAFLPYSNSGDRIPVGDFDKSSESASPGHYKVYLENFEVEVELTATLRVGLHKYTFKNPADRNVMLNLAHILQPSWGGRVVDNSFEILDEKTIQGVRKTTGWARDHVVAYRAEFSEPFIDTKIFIDGAPSNSRSFVTRDAQVHFKFPESGKALFLKVSISPVDVKGAAKNMKAELPGWDFNDVVNKAKDEWRSALRGIEIETADRVIKTNFYTAMYHSMMAPFIWQDVDGRYRSIAKKIEQAPEGHINYTVFSLWDTYRAFHPLMTIIRPEKAAVWSEALVQKYKDGGILPKWPLASNYTGTMVGYPAVSVLADAVAKGLAPQDLSPWLEAAVRSATWRPDIVENLEGVGTRVMPRHIYFKETLGWSPHDSIAQSVSYGLEMAYYDWCVAKIAEAAGDAETASEFRKKGAYFRHYFDAETGLMRGKNYDGSWLTPFRPKFSDHDHGDYVEGNAWQWSFYTPHAMNEIIELYGGPDRYEAMLDTLFTTSSEIEGEHASGDITGLIGQYAHGNEPSHHMAYLYNWTNAKYKGQERLDQIMREFYLPEPAGIIGNEDCGQMSAWYVLSAIGFYQVCPGDPTYTTGRPIVDRAVITVPGGKFEIIAHNNSRENKYVKQVVLNGNELARPFFSHEDLMKGGTLEFFMTDQKF
ncbi:MAG: GH92 family glycosyl hydrolase [Cytophagales bacterium]|nr:GH92 family glycosyl hydrolase [Cytophagales bacterium]